MELYILSAILGLVIGSFLNVVIFRTEKNKSFGGRSYCPKCKKTIPWYDNIPLLGYLLLKGRCRFCHKKINIQYPLVETFTSLAFLSATWLVSSNLLNNWLNHYFSVSGLLSLEAKYKLDPNLLTAETNFKFFELIFIWAIFSILIAIIVYDLKHMLIPDSFTYAGIVATLFYGLVADIFLLFAVLIKNNQLFILETVGLNVKNSPHGFFPIPLSEFFGWETTSFFPQIIHAKQNYLAIFLDSRTGSGLIAGLAVALVFFLIVYLSNETWMGMGDVKLVFFLGLFLGIFKTVVAMFLAFELGAILGIILILFGRAKMKTALPFGPFLIAGAVLSLLFV